MAINKVGDWTLNAEVIEAISSYVSDVTFTGDALVLESATDEAITLANLTNGFTLKSGKLAVAGHDKAITVEGGELELVDSEDDETLLVFETITNKGGSIKVSNPIKARSVVNQKGTLTFAADQEIDALDYNTSLTGAALTTAKNDAWDASKAILSLTNGYYTSATDYSVGKIVIEEGAEVALTANGTYNNNVFVNSKASTLEVKGEFVVRQDYAAAVASPASPEKGFKNNGTLIVTGKVSAANKFLNNGSITDNGNVINVMNAGTITMGEGKRLTLVERTATSVVTDMKHDKVGKVDNTANGIISGATAHALEITENQIYFNYASGLTNNLMVDDDNQLKAPRAVNTLRLTGGTWYISEDFADTNINHDGTSAAVYDKIIFAGANLSVDANATLWGSIIEVETDAKWSGLLKTTALSLKATDLLIKSEKSLTVDFLTVSAASTKVGIWASKTDYTKTGYLKVKEDAIVDFANTVSTLWTAATTTAAGVNAIDKKAGDTDTAYNAVAEGTLN